MRNVLTMLLLFGILSSVGAQNPKSFTLDEAINYALGNSLEVKNAQIGVADANEQIYENRARGLPVVSAGVDYNYYFKLPVSLVPAEFFGGMPGEFAELEFGTKNNLTAKIQAQSLIFDWSYLTALKASRAYKNLSQEQSTLTEAQVRNQVRSAYLPPLLLDESQKTLQKNITTLEKLFFETSEMYKAGFVEQLDVDRLELSLANLKTEMDNLERQKNLAYNYLKMAMNYPMEETITVADDIDKLLSDASADDLEGKINYSNRAEYRVVQKSKLLNQINIDYVKSTYYPNLVGFAQYQQVGQGNNLFKNPNWSDVGLVGLQLNVPIYSGGGKKAKLHRAQLSLEKTNNQIRSLERLIWMEIGNARIAYRNAQQRVADQQKNLALAQRIYDTTKIKYKEGVGSSLEITTAEQSLFQSQQNVIQARYELLQAKMMLSQALGK
ncbi:MAG TPA: TolC family protein [Phaeodactylibacter sp.]|nr:TolC family protein [Phaeodactylibacter sp.]